MGKKLYVGNLPWSVTDEELAGYFEKYGKVMSASVIIDRELKRSKGFGFVEMEDVKSADCAIAGADGADLGGRALKVSEAKERPQRDSRDSHPRDNRGYRDR